MSLYDSEKFRTQLKQVSDAFAEKLKQMRAGRPRAEMFASLEIMMYGTPVTIQSTANISVESATSVTIKPFYMDKQLLEDIQKAVRDMNLGYNPAIDSDKVRVNIPPLTEERRQETIKEMRNMLEDARKNVRQVRQSTIEKVEKAEGVSEDEQKRDKAEIQKLVDAANQQLEEMADKKEEELSTL